MEEESLADGRYYISHHAPLGAGYERKGPRFDFEADPTLPTPETESLHHGAPIASGDGLDAIAEFYRDEITKPIPKQDWLQYLEDPWEADED